MKLLIAVPSKKRPEVFSAYTKPFIDKFNCDKILVLEKEDADDYDFDNKLILDKSNQGLSYSLKAVKKYAQENNYDLIFKIDDDVKTIGTVWEDIGQLIKPFEQFISLGAITFPYKFQFYDKSEKLFTHTNKRLQTCYIIRTSCYAIDQKTSNLFEDFYNFMMLRKQGYFTLFCARHDIDCKPVGKGKGGIQCFDRKQLAIEAIKEFKSIDPTIEVITKKDKIWYYEPKFTDKIYKSKKL